jgi:ribonucleoside-diphosphate reductase beta chain
MENLATRFSKDIPVPEVKSFYAFQNAMEAVHSETYSLLIDTYVKDPVQKDELFNAVTNFPAIKTKADWAIQWIDNPTASFGQRLVGFAIVEGLFFSASFCAIFWLRERGLLPGLSFANQLIARDESMHTDFACLLYSKLNNRLPRETVESMIRDAVEIEKDFILESIPCSMIGMNKDLMTDYIKYIADRLLLLLGYDKIYNTTNPFQFMEMSASETKASFFEVKVSSYAKPVSFVGGQSVIPTELSIDTSDDF